ncbi:MAG: hypothetical protein NVS9B11_07170 [Candidatus Dormibacteraceae bacterium]
MTARRDGGRAKPSVADGSIHGLLADTQEARRFFGTDKSPRRAGGGDLPRVLENDTPVATRGHCGRPQQPFRDGSQDSGPADAKASC